MAEHIVQSLIDMLVCLYYILSFGFDLPGVYLASTTGRAFGIGTPAVLSRNLGESLAQQKAVYTTVNAQERKKGWVFTVTR